MHGPQFVNRALVSAHDVATLNVDSSLVRELLMQDLSEKCQHQVASSGIWNKSALCYVYPTQQYEVNYSYNPTITAAYYPTITYTVSSGVVNTPIIQSVVYPTTNINIDYSNGVDYNVYWDHYHRCQSKSAAFWGDSWYHCVSPPLTPEERAKRLAEQQERDRKAKVADSRADLLLTSLLTPQQATQYREKKHFDLVINGKVYRMNKGRTGNVQLIENGKPVAKYCAHPEMYVPDGDTLVAQMMMLKTDEAAFLKVANRTAIV